MLLILALVGCAKPSLSPNAEVSAQVDEAPAANVAATPPPAPGPQPQGCVIEADSLYGEVENGSFVTVQPGNTTPYYFAKDGSQLIADVHGPVRFSIHQATDTAVTLREPYAISEEVRLLPTTNITRASSDALFARLQPGRSSYEENPGPFLLEFSAPCTALAVTRDARAVPRGTAAGIPYTLLASTPLFDAPDGQAVATLHPEHNPTWVWGAEPTADGFTRLDMQWESGARVAGWVRTESLQETTMTPERPAMMEVGGTLTLRNDGSSAEGTFGSPAPATLAAGALVRSGPNHPAWGVAVQDTPVVALPSTDHPGWLAISELAGVTHIVGTDGTYDAWVDARDLGFDGQPAPAPCSQSDPEGRACQHPPKAFTAHGLSQIDLPQGTYAGAQRDVTVSSFITMASAVTTAMLDETIGATETTADCEDCPAYGVQRSQVILYANALSEQHGLEPAYSWSEFSGPAWGRWKREANGWRLPTQAEWHYTRKHCDTLQESLHACDDTSVAEWIWRYSVHDAPGWQVDPDGGGLGSQSDALGLNEDGTVWHLPADDAVIGFRLVRSSP